MKQLQLISKNQRERTLKLLQDTKTNYGISVYLLMKKMLTVSILTTYFQKKYQCGEWIEYEHFLQRNETLVKCKYDMPDLKSMNGLTQNTFFGIPSSLVLDKSLSDVEVAVIEKWNKDIRET
jgi:hypothetical protein